MKKLFIFQITISILLAGAFGGMFLTTGIYDDIYDTIVSTTCYSCIKMDPIPHLDFTFETANGQPHPAFIVDNLTKGPVFLAFRRDVCEACDIMDPIVQDVFNVDFEMEDVMYEPVDFDGSIVNFMHINLDHASGEIEDSFSVYGGRGVPLFVVITLGNNSGNIELSYAIAEGTLTLDTVAGRKVFFTTMVQDAIDHYTKNYAEYMVTLGD